ncbi:hypothetical protein ACFPRL_26500 [Pseudoclavibacter helvolus]
MQLGGNAPNGGGTELEAAATVPVGTRREVESSDCVCGELGCTVGALRGLGERRQARLVDGLAASRTGEQLSERGGCSGEQLG